MKTLRFARYGAVLAALTFAVPASAQNSDELSFLGVAGSPTIVEKEHPTIRLESERVVLTLRSDDKYTTDGTYVFYNESDKPAFAEIGIPENNSGAGAEKFNGLEKPSAFEKFNFSVDGRSLPMRRGGAQVTDNYDEMRHFFPFFLKAKERVTVRYQALSPVSVKGSGAFTRTLNYLFTGANWKGNIKTSELEVRVPLQGQWSASGVEYPPYAGGSIEVFQPTAGKDGKVGVLRRKWSNWNEATQIQINLRRTLPGWLVEPSGDTTLFTRRELDNASSFEVGAPDADFVGDIPAFVRGGVTLVSFDYLANRAAQLLRDGGNAKTFDVATKRATLNRGGHNLAFRAGSKTMLADGKTVALRVAPAMLKTDGGQALYVPLAPAARALGLKVEVRAAEHQFYIAR